MSITEQQLRDLYGRGAQIIRERTAAIQQQYNDMAAQVDANATSRAQSDAQTAQAQAAGMQSAAKSLGLEAPPQQTGIGSAASFDRVNRESYQGGAGDWRTFLGKTRDITSGRNEAHAQAIEAMGQERVNNLNAFLAAQRSGGGGYGGGGGRGGYYEDEPEQTFPSYTPQMEPGVARGLAATRLRLEKMGAAGMPKNYTFSAKANSDPKRRKAEGKETKKRLTGR